MTKVRHGKQESRGLRLTIKAAKMRHSGIYECRVSNRYQEITKSVELVVWPRGKSHGNSWIKSFYSSWHTKILTANKHSTKLILLEI